MDKKQIDFLKSQKKINKSYDRRREDKERQIIFDRLWERSESGKEIRKLEEKLLFLYPIRDKLKAKQKLTKEEKRRLAYYKKHPTKKLTKKEKDFMK